MVVDDKEVDSSKFLWTEEANGVRDSFVISSLHSFICSGGTSESLCAPDIMFCVGNEKQGMLSAFRGAGSLAMMKWKYRGRGVNVCTLQAIRVCPANKT